MLHSAEQLERLLAEFGQWLEFEDAPLVDWLVCGGAAMSLQNLHMRKTRDVDVLGRWDASSVEVVAEREFPEVVRRCIARVVENHPDLEQFSDSWINSSVSQIVAYGLPDGYKQRLSTRTFGKRLTLRLMHRVDLIPLKLYAASDRFSPRQAIHFADLKLLQPSFEELDRSIEWMRRVPTFHELQPELKSVIESLGHEDLSYYV